MPSKDLIFFVCVASASVKQIDSAITWILSILQKQKQHVSVMESNTWLNMGLMPFHIYAYITMEYDSCICLYLWSGKSNLTTAASASVLVKWLLWSDFAKAMSLPCISNSDIGQTEIW